MRAMKNLFRRPIKGARAHPRLALMTAACVLACAPARAASVSAGSILVTVPSSLFDPLGSLALTPSQFLVPIDVRGADALVFWEFDLHFDAAVAAPADAGGLYQSVYQADFGAGAFSRATLAR